MATAKLDPIDLKIIDAVQRNGRITKVKLAEVMGLSPTPCWKRLNKLESAGIIVGYYARVAPRQIAPFTSVLMEFALSAHRQTDFERFERAVQKIPEIVACWSVGGGVDLWRIRKTASSSTPPKKIGPRVAAALAERGVIGRAMPQGDILGFAPLLCLTREEADAVKACWATAALPPRQQFSTHNLTPARQSIRSHRK